MSSTGYPEPSLPIFRFTTHPENTQTGTCDVCDSLDSVEVEERLIGGVFPNAEQTDENSYDAHVHKTCACTLDMVEENQPPEPETPETQPNMFTYWKNKDTKREDVNISETSSTPSKFAYCRETPEKNEVQTTPPHPKSGNAPQKAKEQPKSAPKHERSEEIKPSKQQLNENAKPSEPEPVKLPEESNQNLEIAQRAPPEKFAVNEQALSKLVYWPSKEEPPTEASAIAEEIESSEPNIAVRQPELETPQLNQPAPVSTQVNHKLPKREAAEAQPETTPPPTIQQTSRDEIPLETNAAPFAYWPTQPPRSSTESLNTPEGKLQRQPQLYSLPAPQQPLAFPEPVTTPETPDLPQPQHSTRKTPVQRFSYWQKGQMPKNAKR